MIVGAGISGLCAGFELKRRGFTVHILERSPRVGGCIITFREPFFAPGLDAEGGAMRIPENHLLVDAYLKKFGLHEKLIDFEMKNKLIYLSGYKGGQRLDIATFEKLLRDKDAELLTTLLPELKEEEKGKTADEIFDEAIEEVRTTYHIAKQKAKKKNPSATKRELIRAGYNGITKAYDKFSLRSFLEKKAEWSSSAISLYNLSNAHVVFENGFIESLKDAFLSSNTDGQKAKMKRLEGGMDQLPKAFFRELQTRSPLGRAFAVSNTGSTAGTPMARS
jgi:monoamine oxidase